LTLLSGGIFSGTLDADQLDILELFLTLLRNILAIADPKRSRTDFGSRLHDRMILAFHEEHVLDMFVALSATAREGASYSGMMGMDYAKDNTRRLNLIILDIMHQLFRMETAEEVLGLAPGSGVLSALQLGTSSNDDLKNNEDADSKAPLIAGSSKAAITTAEAVAATAKVNTTNPDEIDWDLLIEGDRSVDAKEWESKLAAAKQVATAAAWSKSPADKIAERERVRQNLKDVLIKDSRENTRKLLLQDSRHSRFGTRIAYTTPVSNYSPSNRMSSELTWICLLADSYFMFINSYNQGV
jgi:hypothetical protein